MSLKLPRIRSLDLRKPDEIQQLLDGMTWDFPRPPACSFPAEYKHYGRLRLTNRVKISNITPVPIHARSIVTGLTKISRTDRARSSDG